MLSRFSDADQLYERLLGYVNVEKGQATEFKLDRMTQLCANLGDPQEAYSTIHVAGSKGKGSVSIMTSALMEACGHRVGLYTSPHLLRWTERISLAGKELGDHLILQAADEVFGMLEKEGIHQDSDAPTYFELSTLIAFCAFRLAGCDWAVIETGLGGRLDSTNVIRSTASIITPIELEHTEYLGDTIALIAGEKAGIIKPGKACYLARQKEEARRVFEAKASELRSPLRSLASLVRIDEIRVDGSGSQARLHFSPETGLSRRFPEAASIKTAMIGSIQAENMALSILAAGEIESGLKPELAVQALADTRLPARFQIVGGDPAIVIDGAHTPNSAALTLETFEQLFPGPKSLLFACAEDKKHEEMAAILAPHFNSIILTRPGTFKKSDLGAIARSFAKAGAACRVIEDHRLAIESAVREAEVSGFALLVTGSFYLCAEFQKWYQGGDKADQL